MPFLKDPKNRLFRELTPKSEAAFEKTILDLADNIFGIGSIFTTRKRRQKGAGIAGIPDGYLLDFAEPNRPKLFVVEVELRTHDLFKHITEQLVRFAAGFESDQLAVRNFLQAEVHASKAFRARLEAARKASDFENVDALLNKAVFAPFQGLVVIDERTEELDRVLKQFACSISVLEVKSWVSEDGASIYQYETLYDEDEPSQPAVSSQKGGYSAEELVARRQRLAQCDTIVVPAHEEGFTDVFLGENRWYQIRVGAGMRDRIQYIAAYQVAPVSAVTHLAEVKEIRPYGTGGKFQVIFAKPAGKIKKVPLKNAKNAPFGPLYVRREDLLNARSLDDALHRDG